MSLREDIVALVPRHGIPIARVYHACREHDRGSIDAALLGLYADGGAAGGAGAADLGAVDAVTLHAKRSWPVRKYRNVPTIVDGMRFDSKAEARRYGELKLLRQAGEVLWFVRQVPFHLPGNIRYVADFLIVWSDGRTTVEDVKGVLTRVAANKIKQVRALLGVEVQLVGRRR